MSGPHASSVTCPLIIPRVIAGPHYFNHFTVLTVSTVSPHLPVGFALLVLDLKLPQLFVLLMFSSQLFLIEFSKSHANFHLEGSLLFSLQTFLCESGRHDEQMCHTSALLPQCTTNSAKGYCIHAVTSLIRKQTSSKSLLTPPSPLHASPFSCSLWQVQKQPQRYVHFLIPGTCENGLMWPN